MVNATSTIYALNATAETNDMIGFVTAINDLTGQIFMMGILLISFLIFYIALQRFGTSDAMLAAGFITTIMTMLFAALNFVPVWLTVMIYITYGIFFVYRTVVK